MDERNRIRALLEAGKITPEEADTLMEALDELEVQPDEPRAARVQLTIPPEPARLRWVKVSLRSEDLEVRVDPTLSHPIIEGQVSVEEEGSNYGVVAQRRPRRERSQGFLENVLRYFEGDEVKVRLPEGWGLEVHSRSGDVEANDVPFVKGSVGSGDVELERVGGLDLQIQSGELEASLCLVRGEHKLVMGSGDAEISFVDSSVTVGGVLGSGELDPRGDFRQKGRVFKGVVGGGEAKLSIQMGSGDLTLKDQSSSAFDGESRTIWEDEHGRA